MSATYASTTDFTVTTSQDLQATNQDVLWLTQSSGAAAPEFSMQSSSELFAVANAANTASEIYAVRMFGDFAGANFTMAAQSQINVQQQTGGALAGYGIAATGSPNLTLAGTIQVVVISGQATGVLAPFSSAGGSVTLQQSFTMAAVSQYGGPAYGVRMESGGVFQNFGGQVQASAATVAYGVLIKSDGGSFLNAGIISAGGLGDGYGVAVKWEAGANPGTSTSFVNNGALHGDYALVVSATVPDPATQIFISNGSMYGVVDLVGAPSQLFNNGPIYGQVVFGAANDLYDGRLGTVNGGVSGGAGDDTLTGGAAAETLLGGDGNDLIDGGGGVNSLDGGAGVNTLSFRSAAAGYSVDLGSGHATGSVDSATETFSNFQRILASDHGDTITASSGAYTIQGGAGSDLIYAAGGQASLSGGGAVDTLSFLHASGPVTAHFADGTATGLVSATGFEVVQGSTYGDTLSGGGGVLTLSGGAGADSLTAAADTRLLSGDDGGDNLQGASGSNTLFGGDGNDTIGGGSGFNQVNGNKGDDIIVGHSNSGDWLLGGQGQDSIDASASNGANIVNGNIGADTLVGGSGADTLRGGQGDDVIYMGSGNAWISGDLGNNTIYGGQGNDTIHAGMGHDVVHGWHVGDRVQVDGGVTYTVTQVSGDVHVVFSNGGEMDLLNVQSTSLPSDWIIST